MNTQANTVKLSAEAAKELISLLTGKVEEAYYTATQKKGYTEHQVTAYVFSNTGKPSVITYTWITE